MLVENEQLTSLLLNLFYIEREKHPPSPPSKGEFVRSDSPFEGGEGGCF
jgi:hypothetical protein